MRHIIYTFISSIRRIYSLTGNYFIDYVRYVKYSNTILLFKKFNFKKKLETQLTLRYHSLEKALILKNKRKGYGLTKALELTELIQTYINNYGDNKLINICCSVLEEYLNDEFASKDPSLLKKIKTLIYGQYLNLNKKLGGQLIFDKTEIPIFKKEEIKKFFFTRHSIRDFSNKAVSYDEINFAVEMAIRTPSVCNRQPVKVYVVENKKAQKEIIDKQLGNQGWTDNADKLIVLTSDISSFGSVYERNQVYIEGGMFAMTLVYAFHSIGIGTGCKMFLNKNSLNKKIKEIIKCEDSEEPIMLILIGHLQEKTLITQSTRKDINDILSII